MVSVFNSDATSLALLVEHDKNDWGFVQQMISNEWVYFDYYNCSLLEVVKKIEPKMKVRIMKLDREL